MEIMTLLYITIAASYTAKRSLERFPRADTILHDAKAATKNALQKGYPVFAAGEPPCSNANNEHELVQSLVDWDCGDSRGEGVQCATIPRPSLEA